MSATNRDKNGQAVDQPKGPVHRDPEAGAYLKELREERLWPREEIPRLMLRANIPKEQVPSVRTLERIEELGAIPIERIRFGLAGFYNLPVRSIWTPKRERARS